MQERRRAYEEHGRGRAGEHAREVHDLDTGQRTVSLGRRERAEASARERGARRAQSGEPEEHVGLHRYSRVGEESRTDKASRASYSRETKAETLRVVCGAGRGAAQPGPAGLSLQPGSHLADVGGANRPYSLGPCVPSEGRWAPTDDPTTCQAAGRGRPRRDLSDAGDVAVAACSCLSLLGSVSRISCACTLVTTQCSPVTTNDLHPAPMPNTELSYLRNLASSFLNHSSPDIANIANSAHVR